MAQKVKVFNYNSYPLKETFKGEDVQIDANDYWRDKKGNIKEMDIFEATDFRGQYHPVPFDGSGKMINEAQYYKKIRLEPVVAESDSDDNIDDAPVFRCMAKECKHVSPSPEELQAHIKVRHPSIETLELPEVDHEIKRRGRPKKESAA